MKIKLPTIVLAALLFAGLPLASSSAYVGVSVAIAPPAIPVYEQPLCPVEGYIWTPGYWGYGDIGYYWVPGVWVAPPRFGVLWTPGYWGYRGGRYLFNDGYWGPTVGFYGGINYGFGYGGRGYYGGQWAGNTFRYNTAVTRVNTTVIHNTYVNKTVVNNNTGSRAGFNGPGGAKAKPNAQEQAAAKADRVPATEAQRSRVDAAKKDPALQAKNNGGKPKSEALNAFSGKGNEGAATKAETATGTGKQAGAENGRPEKQANTENQARPGKQAGAENEIRAGKKAGSENQVAANQSENKAGKANGRSTAAKSDRTNQGASSHAPRANQASRNGKANNAVKNSQGPPRGARPATVQKGTPGSANHGPAGGPQKGKKKKRPNDAPGGQ